MEEAWELAAVSDGLNTSVLRSLHKRARALVKAMEATSASEGEDFGKWYATTGFIRAYQEIAELSVKELTLEASGGASIRLYDLSKLKKVGDYTWPTLKGIFHNLYLDALALEALLSDFESPAISEMSEIEEFLSQRLRKTFSVEPNGEIEVQDNIESLLIGRGLNKPSDYDRETGRTKSSGKEDIPDFVLKSSMTALEVKLTKDKSSKRSVIEQMRADIVAYKVSYERILFVVYDLGAISDVTEFTSGFETSSGVRVVVVKH